MNIYLTQKQKRTLAQARQTYGDSAQILVANEELCELAAVCAKFPRYSDREEAKQKLHDKAVDEVADVYVILEHVINIFGLTEEELTARVGAKIDRLSRWLESSDSMQKTTEDREVVTPPRIVIDHKVNKVEYSAKCKGCNNFLHFTELKPGGKCYKCALGENNYESKEKSE